VTKTYKLRNPHTLPMVIERSAGKVRASFPAVPDCEGVSFHPDPWKARGEAILDCAKAIVASLKEAAQREAVESNDGP
jgi:hypothetical protein